MRLTIALAPAWNQNNAEPSAAFVAHIEDAFIEPRHDQHDSARLAQHIPRIAERFVVRQVHDGLGARSANGRCDGWCDTRGSARRRGAAELRRRSPTPIVMTPARCAGPQRAGAATITFELSGTISPSCSRRRPPCRRCAPWPPSSRPASRSIALRLASIFPMHRGLSDRAIHLLARRIQTSREPIVLLR